MNSNGPSGLAKNIGGEFWIVLWRSQSFFEKTLSIIAIKFANKNNPSKNLAAYNQHSRRTIECTSLFALDCQRCWFYWRARRCFKRGSQKRLAEQQKIFHWYIGFIPQHRRTDWTNFSRKWLLKKKREVIVINRNKLWHQFLLVLTKGWNLSRERHILQAYHSKFQQLFCICMKTVDDEY